MRRNRGLKRFFAGMLTAAVFFSGVTLPVSAKPEQEYKISDAPFKLEVKMIDTTSTDGSVLPVPYDAEDYSFPADQGVPRAVLPATYDLRTQGLSTTVKDQGIWGACWAFGALASLESNVLMQKGSDGVEEAALPDYSELQLGWFALEQQTEASQNFNQTGEGLKYNGDESQRLNSGGNYTMSAAVLAAWQGAADEADVPYQNRKPVSINADKRNLSSIHLQNMNILPETALFDEENNYTFSEAAAAVLKEELMENGAVQISYYADQSTSEGGRNGTYFNYDTWAQYVDTAMEANHVVAIVGWDDNYSRENFNEAHRPERDGAWIVKNSWGTGSWGEDGSGYFYLSYYDHSICEIASVMGDVQKEDGTYTYDNNYQYDYLGMASAGMVLPIASPLSVANVFTAKGSEELRAVSACTTCLNAKVEVRIYKLNKDWETPLDGVEVSSFTETIPYAGYHTLELAAPVSLQRGDEFSVVETISSEDAGSTNYYLPIELGSDTPVNDITWKAVGNPGESFIIEEGDVFETSGNIGGMPSGNAMIKAFTVNVDSEAPALTSLSYEVYDNRDVKLGGTKNVLNPVLEKDNGTELPEAAAYIKIAGISLSDGADSSQAAITVQGNPYTVGDKIERSLFEKEPSEPSPVVVTTKSVPAGKHTKTYGFSFTVPDRVVSSGDGSVKVTDSHSYLPSGVNVYVEKVTTGNEYDLIKSALAPYNGDTAFTIYQTALKTESGADITLDAGSMITVGLKRPAEYPATERTKLYIAEFHDGEVVLTEVTDASKEKEGFLSAQTDRMGYFVVSVIKEVPSVPVLENDTITYSPAQTLRDISLPKVDGGVWKWEHEDTVPTVAVSSYPAVFTPDAGSDYRNYQADITLHVQQAVPVVTNVSGNPITYGQTLADSALTGETGGVKGRFTWENEAVRPNCKNSGYPVLFTPDDTVNYTTVTTTATLTVSQREANIKVKDVVIAYGDPVPKSFEAEAARDSNLVNGDTIADVKVTDLQVRVDGLGDTNLPGTYEIVFISAKTAADSNYTIGKAENGKLKITGDVTLKIRDIDDDTVKKLFEQSIGKEEEIYRMFDAVLEGLDGELQDAYELALPVGTEYEGKKVTVLHYLKAGAKNKEGAAVAKDSIDRYDNLTVTDGKVTVQVYSLSPFAVVVQKADSDNEKPVNEPGKPGSVTGTKNLTGKDLTGKNLTGAKTGDEAALQMMLLLAALSLMAIVFTVVMKKRKH